MFGIIAHNHYQNPLLLNLETDDEKIARLTASIAKLKNSEVSEEDLEDKKIRELTAKISAVKAELDGAEAKPRYLPKVQDLDLSANDKSGSAQRLRQQQSLINSKEAGLQNKDASV